MVEYTNRRLRFWIFTFYNIHKDCVQTCKNLESLTKIQTFTLYDLLKPKIRCLENNLRFNFLLLVTKCIIVQITNENNEIWEGESKDVCDLEKILKPFKTLKMEDKQLSAFVDKMRNNAPSNRNCTTLKFNNKFMCSESSQKQTQKKDGDMDSYINNPMLFFNSEIGKDLNFFPGNFRITDLIPSQRILIPVGILELSNSSIYSFIQSLKQSDTQYKYAQKLVKFILNKKYRFKDGDNLRTPSQIFIQCSGQILYNQVIKPSDSGKKQLSVGSKWSNMVIYRKFIYFRRGNSKKNMPFKTIFDSMDRDKTTLWTFFTFIIFNNRYYSENLKERKECLDWFLKLLNINKISADKKHKNNGPKSVKFSKNLLQGLFAEFSKFMNNLNRVDWEDKKYLRSEPLAGTNLKTVTFHNVYKYVKSIVEQTITPELLCGKSNYLNFLKVCYSLITLNKGENLSMSEVMKGFKIKDCVWIKRGYHSMGQTRTILDYLCRIIFFILQYLIIPALGRFMYITECGFSMYRIHYIRVEDWFKMLNGAGNDYLKNGKLCIRSDSCYEFPKLRFIPKQSGMRPILNCNTPAGCREYFDNLITKYKHKFKPHCKCYFCIVNKKLLYSTNLNRLLKFIHHALTVNSKINPILGNGVLGYNSFYKHLKKWWFKLIRQLKIGSDIKFYYFVADLSKCYERIPHDKLMEVLKNIPLVDANFSVVYKRFLVKLSSSVNSFAKIEDIPYHTIKSKTRVSKTKSNILNPKLSYSYMNNKVNNINIVNRKSSNKSKVTNSNVINGVKTSMRRISTRLYGNSVIASGLTPTKSFTITRYDILSAVSSLISSQNLRLPSFGNDQYIKLDRGIPQGCCISPFLSSMYLASLDKSLSFRPNITDMDNETSMPLPNLLVRWIDDFLFVSTNPDDVNSLSKLLCYNNFGVVINTKKVVTNASRYSFFSSSTTNPNTVLSNLQISQESSRTSSQEEEALRWINCRFNFDMVNRFINVEIVPWKISDIRIRDTISLSKSRTHSFMFSVIEQRLIGYIMNKLSHKTYTCSMINSPECIVTNSYFVMRTCSLKLSCAIRVLVRDFGCFVNLRYFYKLILNLITITSNLVSKGGLNIRRHYLREILMIAVIYTFKYPSTYSRKSRKGIRKLNCLELINKKIMCKFFHHVNSLLNKDDLFSIASIIEDKYKIHWSKF
uniref:Telomerase reverse transcriptase n=1 Tax=Theileria annulata TaxID=5874 RepID=A0A3B0NED1_THEAN